MDREYPTVSFPPRSIDAYLEVEYPTAHVRRLVAELGEDWPVFDEYRGGVGIEPWGLRGADQRSVHMFFGKFVELAATDAYGTLKNWLQRVNGRRKGYIELRDPDRDGSRRIETPITEGNLHAAVADQVVAALRTAGERLEEADDLTSLRQARALYQAAAELELVGFDHDLAVARLIRLLRRLGDAASMEEAEGWSRKAAAMGIGPARLDELLWEVEASREVNRLRARYEDGLLSKANFLAKVEEIRRSKP